MVTTLRDCIDSLLMRTAQTEHDASSVFKSDFVPLDLHQLRTGGRDGEHNLPADDVLFQFDNLRSTLGLEPFP